MKETYENIPISDKAKAGMSFTSDDIHYLQRMFYKQDNSIETLIADTLDHRDKELCKSLAQVMAEQNARMFTELEKQTVAIGDIKLSIIAINQRLDEMQENIDNYDSRLNKLEKKTSWQNIVLIIIAGISTGICLGLLIHKLWL